MINLFCLHSCVLFRFGRKVVLLGGVFLTLVFGVAGAFSPNYATFVTLRFLFSVVNAAAYLASYVLSECYILNK